MHAQPVQLESSEQQQALSLLKIYTFYRTILAIALLLTFVIAPTSLPIGNLKPTLFLYTTTVYLAINLVILFIVLPKTYVLNNQQIFANFIVDIAAVIIIADTAGGITSGLGILLVVIVAASSIILKNQLATLIAAAASLAIILDTARLIAQDQLKVSSFLPSGLLGIILFITSFLIQNLSSRIRNAQIIAAQNATELTTLQHLNHLIVQRMRTGILVVNSYGNIQTHNDAALELLSVLKSPTTRTLTLPRNLHAQFNQWLSTPSHRSYLFRETQTGPSLQASFSLLTDSVDDNVLIFLEDNRQLTQRAQQMKLASLGRLTASIAHEIRNPLSAVSHAAQLLAESTDITVNDKRLCEIIQNHSRRMDNIIENVLRLSQRKAPNPEKVTLFHWLNQFIKEYQSEDYPNADIRLVSQSQGTQVNVDLSQLGQIITNLVNNGIRHSDQYTGKATLTLDFHLSRSTLLPVLDIIDDGKGISEQHKDHIFEPFFTTETTGTGLGLYISRELCEANQARLDYIRLNNNKSCFRISFAHPNRRVAPD